MAPPTEPFTPNFYAGDLICDGWTVEGEIGRGGCGVVYQVSAKVTEQLNGVMTERIIHAAMKCEGVDHDGRYSETLHSEVTVLRRMQRSEHVCRLYRAGRFSASVNVVIMSLVGRSLSFMRRLCKDRCFSTSTAIRVAFQCLEAIQELHFIGYIHRDIKPCNFAIGLYPDDVRRVVLLDFGFSRQYLKKGYDGQMRHRYPRSRAPFLGTPRYCSMNSADGKEQGRCDDLWSWMFMLVEFIEGKLPWKNCATPVELNREKRQALDTLLDGCPHQLYRIFDHIQTLKYADRPDYNMMFSTLRIIWEVEQVSQEDLVLDWEAGGRCHKRYLQAEMSRPQMKKLKSRIPRIMKKSPRGEACRPAVIQEKPKWRWCHMVTGTPKYANLSVRKNYSNVVNENCGRQHTDKIVASDLIIANVQTDQNVSETSCLELIANDDEATGLFDVICDGRKRCHESMLNMLIHLFSTLLLPYIIAHNPKQYASVLWLNATETWTDIDSSTADKGVLASLVDKFRSSQEVSQIDAHFMTESGMIDVFIFLGPTPNDVFRQYSTLIGVYSLQGTAITKSTFWRTVRRCVYVYCGIEVIGTHAGEVYCTGVSMHPTILHGGLGIAERPFSSWLMKDFGQNPLIVERVVVGLLRLTGRVLYHLNDKDEDGIADNALQSLSMLLSLKPPSWFMFSRRIAYGLHDLLQAKAANVHQSKHWPLIFALMDAAGAAACASAQVDAFSVICAPESPSSEPSKWIKQCLLMIVVIPPIIPLFSKSRIYTNPRYLFLLDPVFWAGDLTFSLTFAIVVCNSCRVADGIIVSKIVVCLEMFRTVSRAVHSTVMQFGSLISPSLAFLSRADVLSFTSIARNILSFFTIIATCVFLCEGRLLLMNQHRSHVYRSIKKGTAAFY
ncbi:hypothetical protein QR680_002906 [Steinernema hermaphroditum]|uniref:Protein kinase domain-containing protein n=1 Tax=Steinernema hermaphroditum TaxID=289476 RepID=A0AA39LIN1_9BILA|nr:hypothetical protein QR680_002906 [Steinernema hermaphroditum]